MVLFVIGVVELGRTPVQDSAFPCRLKKPVSLNPVSIHHQQHLDIQFQPKIFS
jgi:hypothetical protein